MDIAALGLKVDGRQVETAEQALDKLVVAADKAEKAVTDLGRNSETELKKVGRGAQQAADSHVSAYRRQQQAGQDYLRTLQNEVDMLGKTRGQVEALKAAQAGLTAEQQRAAMAMGNQIEAMRGQTTGLTGAVQGLGAVMGGVFAVERVYTFTKALFDASVNGERLRTTLDFASGGNGAKELQYVEQFANKLGLQLDSTAKAYASLAAAAKGTSLEGEGARKVFEGVSKAAAVLGLSADDTSGVLRALTQVMSKGTLQAEEIRGQIGERLPGAFQTAARAMGVTTAELSKMLEQGLVPASEFLPKFADQMEKEFGGAAEAAGTRLEASLNRFDTAWEKLKRAAGDSGVARGFANTADTAASGFDALSQSIRNATASNTFGEWFNSLIWSSKNLGVEIKMAQDEVIELTGKLSRAPNNIYFKSAMADARAYLAELQAVQQQQAMLSGASVTGGGRGSVNPETIAQRAAADQQRKEREDELKSYLTRNATLSKAQVIEKEIAAARERSAKMAEKQGGDLVANAQITKALEQEIANIREKHKPKGGGAAAAAANDSINAELEAFRRGQQVQEEIARRTIANINAQRREGAITAEDAARQVAAVEAELNAAAITALQMQIAEVQRKKNSNKEVAALEGQIAVQREKQLTREAQLEQEISDIRRERAEANERRHNDEENKRQAELTTLEENNKKTREEIELIGLNEKQIQAVISARLDHTVALQRERVARMREMDQTEESTRLLGIEERKLQELTDQRDLYNEGANKTRVAKAQNEANDSMLRWAEDFNSGIADGLVTAITEGGKEGGKALREQLKESLLKQPLKVMLNGVMNQITGNLLNMVFGALGGGGGALGAAAGGGNLLSMASNAYSAYNFGSSALSVGSQWAAGTMSGANAMGTMYANMTKGGIDALLATNGAYGTAAGGAAGAGAGAGSLTGAGVAGLIAAIAINVFGGMRSESMIGSGLRGTLDGRSNLQPWEEWREGGTLISGSEFTNHNPLATLEDYRKKIADYRALPTELQNSPQRLETWERIVREMEKNTAGLSEQVNRQSKGLNEGYNALRSNVVSMANSLGLAGSKVENFAFELDMQDLNFQGLKPEEIQEKIAKVMEKAGNSMAKELLGYMKPVTETLTREIRENVGSSEGQDSMYVYRTETETSTKLVYVASQWAKAGETALETLTRLSGSMTTFNNVADALGFGMQEISLAAADAADKFIEAAGGIERVTNTSRAFIDAYYSDDKKREALARQGAREAQALGFKDVTAESLLNGSPEQMLAAVNSLAADPKTYFDAQDWAVRMRGLWNESEKAAPAVEAVSNALGDLTKKFEDAVKALTQEGENLQVDLMRALGDDKGADALERQLARSRYLAGFSDLSTVQQAELARLYDLNQATRDRIKAINDEKTATKNALTALRDRTASMYQNAEARTDKFFEAFMSAAQDKKTELEEVRDGLQAIFDTLSSNVTDLYRSVDSSAQNLAAAGRAVIAQALASGQLPDAEKLTEAIDNVRNGFDKQTYSSKFESERDRLVLAGQLSSLKDTAGDQLTEAEQEVKLLDDLIAEVQKQYNELRGINTSAGNIEKMFEELAKAAAAEYAVKKANAGTLINGSAIYDSKTGGGLTADGTYFNAAAIAAEAAKAIAANPGAATANAIYDMLDAGGFTLAQYNQMFGMPPGTLEREAEAMGRPVFHNGTGYVGSTGWAVLERGESVTPKEFNPLHTGVGAMAAVQQQFAAAWEAQNRILREIADQSYRTAEATNGRGDAPQRVRGPRTTL